MDTLSPQSVLDHRLSKDSHVIADRITRGKSPNRQLSPCREFGPGEDEILNRVPQPYRTSFSAVTSLERRDRSRSTSPTTTIPSLKSIRSRSKSPSTRKNHPKHVTYDSVVTVRRSNSYEVQRLSGEDDMANKSVDYQSRIREMSEMIVKEYSSPDKDDVDTLFPSDPPRKSHDNVKNGAPNGRLPKQRSPPKHVLSKDYENDRTISYRKAIHDHYSPEIRQLADNVVDERYASAPHDIGLRSERSNSLPSREETNSNKLTPHKRTISGSISNFFRRMSPRTSRKQRKERGSKTSLNSKNSQESETSSNFSRSKVRNSFMKLLKRPRSKSSSSRSKEENDDTDGGFRTSPSNERILRSIEHNNMSDKEVYNRFKDRQGESERYSDGQNKPQAVKASHPAAKIEIKIESPSPRAWSRGSENKEPLRYTREPGRRYKEVENREAVQYTREPGRRNREVENREPVQYTQEPGQRYRDVENRDPVQYTREPGQRYREQKSRSPPPSNEKPRDQPTVKLSESPKESQGTLEKTMPSVTSADESIGDCSLDVSFTGKLLYHVSKYYAGILLCLKQSNKNKIVSCYYSVA